MAASPGHWSGTQLKGRGNGLLHGLTIHSSRTAYICMATAMVLLGVAFVWVSYVQSMSHVGSDRGCSQAGRLDGAILFGWECLVLWMHAVPCYLASRLEN